jgi:hypothetical protein
MSDSVPAELHQLTFTCHENCRRRSHLVRHGKKTRPDLDLLAASIPALRSSCQCGGARIINSPNPPSRGGVCLRRGPGEQNQFERSHPNAG